MNQNVCEEFLTTIETEKVFYKMFHFKPYDTALTLGKRIEENVDIFTSPFNGYKNISSLSGAFFEIEEYRRTSSIVQIIFSFWSCEISEGILINFKNSLSV